MRNHDDLVDLFDVQDINDIVNESCADIKLWVGGLIRPPKAKEVGHYGSVSALLKESDERGPFGRG